MAGLDLNFKGTDGGDGGELLEGCGGGYADHVCWCAIGATVAVGGGDSDAVLTEIILDVLGGQEGGEADDDCSGWAVASRGEGVMWNVVFSEVGNDSLPGCL